MVKKYGYTICDVCGTQIYFKRNERGVNVPFSKHSGMCHFEKCSLKPRKELEDQPQPKQKVVYVYNKPKIKYETIRANTTLDKFIPIKK